MINIISKLKIVKRINNKIAQKLKKVIELNYIKIKNR